MKPKNERCVELREYLIPWAVTMLKRRRVLYAEDLVHDTLVRLLESDTISNTHLTDDELRAFAWATMRRLLVDRRRKEHRRRKNINAISEFCTYECDSTREVEIDYFLSKLGPRDTHALSVIANSGSGAIRRLTEEPGLSARDLPRLHKKIKRELTA